MKKSANFYITIENCKINIELPKPFLIEKTLKFYQYPSIVMVEEKNNCI